MGALCKYSAEAGKEEMARERRRDCGCTSCGRAVPCRQHSAELVALRTQLAHAQHQAALVPRLSAAAETATALAIQAHLELVAEVSSSAAPETGINGRSLAASPASYRASAC